MWEYEKFEVKHKTTNELIRELNKIGSENWEVFFYEEHKPQKFGENYTSIIIVKRLKPLPA